MGKTFYKDLNEGSRAELFVLEQLREKHPTMSKVEGKCIDYDLVDREGYTVEVKLDKKSKVTNNIAIEYRHRGVRAGISISRAKAWAIVYYLKGTGWVWSLIPTKELRTFLVNNWEFLRKDINPDDPDKSETMLVRTEDFANQFNYYKILDKQQGVA
jgi:hypothetical protein